MFNFSYVTDTVGLNSLIYPSKWITISNPHFKGDFFNLHVFNNWNIQLMRQFHKQMSFFTVLVVIYFSFLCVYRWKQKQLKMCTKNRCIAAHQKRYTSTSPWYLWPCPFSIFAINLKQRENVVLSVILYEYTLRKCFFFSGWMPARSCARHLLSARTVRKTLMTPR